MKNAMVAAFIGLFSIALAILLKSQKASFFFPPIKSPPHSPSPQITTQDAGTTSTLPSRSALYPDNLENDPTVNSIGQRAVDNTKHARFTLHANGDGLGEGLSLDSINFRDVDDIISQHCCVLMNMSSDRCEPNTGARLVSESGVRLLSFNDLDSNTVQRVYCVPNSVHFVWPMKHTGQVIFPKNVKSSQLGPIKLVQLSETLRVFSVENFVSQEEIAELLENNENRMTPSEVGFGGWQDSTRTSSTSWDFTSQAALDIQKRTFEILGMDHEPELADAMQVLKYEVGKWYKPHVDWFSKTGYDGSDPKVENGTNRFATMFLYLSTVEEGGHTVFPLSTTHEGYNGEQLTHPGTVNTPGYIKTEEAMYCCSLNSTALRSRPVSGNAVLFYSQGPDGTLDPFSLHGGCPPIVGNKWSANVWVWNRKRPDKSAAKDKRVSSKSASHIHVEFTNKLPVTVELFWDGNAPTTGLDDLEQFTRFFQKQPTRFKTQGTIETGHMRAIQSFHGHVFVAVDDLKRVRWIASIPSTAQVNETAVFVIQ